MCNIPLVFFDIFNGILIPYGRYVYGKAKYIHHFLAYLKKKL